LELLPFVIKILGVCSGNILTATSPWRIQDLTLPAPWTALTAENTLQIPCFAEFKRLTTNEVSRLILYSKSTTCELDILPTPILKDNVPIALPILTDIINTSGVFQSEWKVAVIRPLLKKNGLPLELKNYRPVSNLTFLSKFLEKSALKQITEHIEGNNLLPSYQIAYRRFHGVKTAMIKIYHDLLDSVDKSNVTLVVMIDLSAAFDTIGIQMALDILQTDFGIQGTPLNWMKSYISQRTMKVTIGSSPTDSTDLKYGVPQGFCAGPVIFTMYVAALRKVVRQYLTDIYGYADDHKLAFRFQAGNQHEEAIVLQHLNECLADIINWKTSFKLKMNKRAQRALERSPETEDF